MKNDQNPRFARSLGASVIVLLLVFAGFALGKEFGMVDNDTARKGVSIVIGLMLIVCGNYLPKMTFAAGAHDPELMKADRLAGWIIVLTGLAFTLVWIFLSIEQASVTGPALGLFGAIATIGVWAWTSRHVKDRFARLYSVQTSLRLAVMMIIVSLFFVMVIFQVDRIWGDEAAQWLAIIFTLFLTFFGASSLVRKLSDRK